MRLAEGPVITAVVERYAGVLAHRTADLGERPLVVPNGRFFPDRFDRDEASLARLLERMQAHAGMVDVPIVPRVHASELAPAGKSCGTGACSTPAGSDPNLPRLSDDGERWALNVPSSELAAPVVLTTMIARALGHVFLIETSRTPSDLPTPLAVGADLAAVALGFGPLLLEGSYIYSKSCGGPHIGCATHLSVEELAVALALFVQMGAHSPRPVLKELGVTQREALSEALEWARSNDGLVRKLLTAPAAVAAGDFKLQPARPWLLRVFGRKPPAELELPGDLSALDLAALEAAMPRATGAAKSPVDDELKALVDEAFRAGSRADAE